MLSQVEQVIAERAALPPQQIPGQCAWCHSVYDGEFAGLLLFRRATDGKVTYYHPETFSHGCCAECEKRVVDHRKRAKLRERSAPQEIDGVLYFSEDAHAS